MLGFFGDPYPRILVNDATIDAVPRLPTWVSVLCAAPFFLFVVGGVIGALIGVAASRANFLLARGDRPVFARWILGPGSPPARPCSRSCWAPRFTHGRIAERRARSCIAAGSALRGEEHVRTVQPRRRSFALRFAKAGLAGGQAGPRGP
jgi:hypothetical protein